MGGAPCITSIAVVRLMMESSSIWWPSTGSVSVRVYTAPTGGIVPDGPPPRMPTDSASAPTEEWRRITIIAWPCKIVVR